MFTRVRSLWLFRLPHLQGMARRACLRVEIGIP